MHFRREFLPYFLIIGFIFIIMASVFYFSFFGGKTQQNTETTKTLPARPNLPSLPQEIDTKNLQDHPNSSTTAQTIDEASQTMLDKDSAIGNLLTKLPYKGTFFILEYNYETNSFTATLSSNNKAQASQEFDQFLKSNQIESRNWLYNLKINNI